MKSKVAPYILSISAVVAMTTLAACNNSGSGGARVARVPIMGPGVPGGQTGPNGGPVIPGNPGAPGVPAQQVPTQAQNQMPPGGGASVPVQQDPQQRRAQPQVTDNGDSDPIGDACINGDEPSCKDVPRTSNSPAPAVKRNGNPATVPLPNGDDDESGDGNRNLSQNGADLPMTKKPVQWLSSEYTGAARDAYRSHLTLLMDSKMRGSTLKSAYYKAVSTITRVKAFLQGQVLQVTVIYKDGGSEKVVILGGAVDAQTGVARLTKQNKTVEKNTSLDPGIFGSTAMTGTAVCADEGAKNCHVLLIRLEVGSKKVPVWVIHRSTNADVSMPLWQGPSGNTALDRFYSYFANTPQQVLASVNVVTVDSFEVIHGATGMKITTLMNDNQVVSARGPLLAPKDSILTNVEWKRDLEIQDLYNQEARSGFRSDLQNSLSSVHLVTNDGRQEFSLLYSVPTEQKQKAGDVTMTYVRRQPLVKDIEAVGALLRGAGIRTEL